MDSASGEEVGAVIRIIDGPVPESDNTEEDTV